MIFYRSIFFVLAMTVANFEVTEASPLRSTSMPDYLAKIALSHGIPADLFWAVVVVESGTRMKSGRYMPWPWSLNIQGRSRFYATRVDAYKDLVRYLREGVRNIDVGYAQLSWRWHSEKLKTPWLALDPHHNLTEGARYLAECYRRYRHRFDAAACYHVGPSIRQPGKQIAIANYLDRIRSILPMEVTSK